MSMATRPLGRTGLQVSVLGFGAMELRGRPVAAAIRRGGGDRDPVDSAEAGRLLHAVLDSGITLIDTSIDYGHSEEFIGQHLASRRDEYVLASKCGCALGLQRVRRGWPHDYRPRNLRAGVEQSLRRLRTDHLDLVQVHLSPSPAQLKADDVIATLQALQSAGKVRFIGMSGTLPHLPAHIATGVFDVVQIPYSAVQREHEELISGAAAAGAGTMIRGSVARGAPDPGKGWRHRPIDLAAGLGQQRWEAAGLGDLLAGLSPIEFMLRFTISHPDVSTAIVGTRDVEHLRANAEFAARGPLPGDVYREALRRLGAAGSVPVCADRR